MGHKYHMDMARQKTGTDGVALVMSGNFVQRGEIAVIEKFSRAKSAVLSGADLVFELPTVYASMSARGFSFGAVSLINSIGGFDFLSFGSESGDLESLSFAADALRTKDFDDVIKGYLDEGLSYPSAAAKAAQKIDPRIYALLKSPNNTLAVEYLSALKELNSQVEPHTLKIDRTNTSPSASDIRRFIKEIGLGAAKGFLPEPSFEILQDEIKSGLAPVFFEDIERTLLAVLKSADPESFKNIPDISEGLHSRMQKAVFESKTLESLLHSLKTKRYTMARIKRILLRAYLGIYKNYSKTPAPYARVLAMNAVGQKMLRDFKKTSQIPIILKPAAMRKESELAREVFSFDVKASNLYALCQPRIGQSAVANEYKTGPVIL